MTEQATSVNIEDGYRTLKISAIHCPPKHGNMKHHFEHFFQTLSNKFIVGGDYNAKHPRRGSRAANSKGNELAAAIQDNNLKCLPTGEPTLCTPYTSCAYGLCIEPTLC